MFNKLEVFDEVGGYRPEEECMAEDYSLWGRMIECSENLSACRRKLLQIPHPSRTVRLEAESRKFSAQLTKKIGIGALQKIHATVRTGCPAGARGVDNASRDERKWKEWWWFLTHCAPGLRWKSAETRLWLALQTAKMLAGF